MAYRLLKNYNLNYHRLPNAKELVPGHTISMSSYAGVVLSLDDFYLLSSGLATTETTLFVYNTELFRDAPTTDIVYEPFRVMTANRLATNGSQWQSIFRKYNSGTYNNQWMVVDYNLLKNSTNLEDEVLVVSEQLPAQSVVKDQTEVLRSQGYWSSYNRAFYPEIFERSGATQLQDQYGDWFSHSKTPRANILRRDQSKVTGMDSLMKLMRYNDFENDPLAKVEGCNPPNIPAGAIANRLDLADPNGTCIFAEHDHMIGHWG